MSELPSFAVIIPMYNEAAGAETCVRKVCAQLAAMPHRTSLIVVNDGSTDGTSRILDTLQAAEPKLVIVNHSRNQGYGAAIRSGIRRASEQDFQYALFMDSDLTNSPEDIPSFAERMAEGADIIKASRFSRGGQMSGVPWRRAFFSRSGNLLARWLFGVGLHDCTNGFRAVKLSLLMRLELKETGFAIIVEELYKAKYIAHSFDEVPTTLTSRSQGQRPSSFQYKPAIFLKYLTYALKAFGGIKPNGGQGIAA